MGFFNNCVPFGTLFISQLYIEAGLASIVNATMPFFTLVLAHFFTQNERITWHKTLGLVIAFLGVVILLSPKIQLGSNYLLLGVSIAFLAPFSYSIAAIYGKRLSNYHFIENSTAMLIASSIILLPYVLIIDEIYGLRPSMDSIISVLIFAILCTVIAYMLYFTLLKRAGSVFTSLVTIIMPPFTVILAYFILGETITTYDMIAMVCIMIGVIIMNKLYSFRKFT